MKYAIFRYLGGVSVATLLATMPVHAQDQDMSDMDTDQSGTVSQDEFGASWDRDSSNIGTSMDTDQSGSVSEDEFTQGGTQTSDTTGRQSWSDQDFSQADTDQSGDLNDQEMSTLIFVIYDEDQSGDLDEEEYQSYSDDEETMGNTNN